MKQFLVLFLLLLSTLVHEAQGRHLKKGNLSARNPMLQQENALKERIEGASGDQVIVCKDEQCSSTGRNRKLITTKTTPTTSTPTTTSTKNIKNEGNKGDNILKGQSSSEKLGGKEENFAVSSSPETGHQKTSEHYPDVLDLAGMDYSPAKRKPPIHN